MSEPTRGPGQPPIGPQIKFSCPPDLLEKLDRRAERDKTTRAGLIRTLLVDALTERGEGHPGRI